MPFTIILSQSAPYYIITSMHFRRDLNEIEREPHFLDLDIPFIYRYLFDQGIHRLDDDRYDGLGQFLTENANGS